MRDLVELEALVRDPDSRPHFHEAVRAFQSGAYRAAVIETWVAVAIDLMNKIRHLSETGDGKAADKVDLLDKAIESKNVSLMQGFERGLLEMSEKELDLISSRGREELKRLYDDRNRCAHPSFLRSGDVFSPSAELVRGHMAAAVDNALALPPIPGKQIIDNLKRDLDSNSWPRDGEVVEYIRRTYFTHPRISVRHRLADLLLKWALRPPDETDLGVVSPNKLAHRCRGCINAINEFSPEFLTESTGRLVLKWEQSGALTDEVLLRMVGALGHIPAFWTVIDDGTRSRIVALLENAPAELLIDERVFSSGRPAEVSVGAAYDSAVTRVALDFENLDRLVRIHSLDPGQWVRPTLDALCDSPNFRSAESRLRCLLRLASHVTEPDLRRAAIGIRANRQVNQASDAPQLLLNLYRETAGTPDAIEVWKELAAGLNGDYMADHEDPDGYYSYKELLDEVMKGPSGSDVAVR